VLSSLINWQVNVFYREIFEDKNTMFVKKKDGETGEKERNLRQLRALHLTSDAYNCHNFTLLSYLY